MTTTFFHRVMAVLLAIGVLISLATLLIYPLPTCDETSYASAALSITVRGASAPLSYAQGMPGAGGLFAIMSFGRKLSTYNLALAALMRLLGTSLIIARLFAWCGWLTSAALTYGLGRKLHSHTVGLISALLFMTSTKAYLTGHTARPEIWVTAAVLAALLAAYNVIASPEPQKWWLIVGAGALSVWAGEIHMQGALFTAAIGAIMLIEVGIRQRRSRDFTLFAAGVTLGAALWIGMLIASGFGIDALTGLGRYASPIPSRQFAGTPGNRWVRNLLTLPAWFEQVFWSAASPLAAIEALFALIGISVAIWKRDRAGLVLASVALIALALFGIAHRNRWVQYGVLWSPLWYLLGTMAITRLKRHDWAVITLAAAHIAGMAWLGWQYRDSYRLYDATGAALRDAVPAGTSVAADPIWWWQLQNRQFLADEYFSYAADTDRIDVQAFMQLDEQIDTPEAAQRLFHQIAPDYFVIDGALACSTTADARYEAMREVVEAECEEIAIVGEDLSSPLRASSLGQRNTIYRCGD